MAPELTTIPLSGPIRLNMQVGHGTISVSAVEGLPEAVVRLTPREAAPDVLDRFTVEMRGATLDVTGPRQGGLSDIIGGWRRGHQSVDVRVEVPAGTPVKVATASEEVTLTGTFGDADVASARGDVAVDTVDGDLRLRYGHGNCRVGSVTGSASLSSGSGTAHFGEVGGTLDCKAGSGEIVADRVGGSVRTRAGSGSAVIGVAYGDIDVTFGRGPVSVGLPAGVSARVDLTTGTGQVYSDLPVEQAAASERTISVRVRTGSGDIRLQRPAAEAA